MKVTVKVSHHPEGSEAKCEGLSGGLVSKPRDRGFTSQAGKQVVSGVAVSRGTGTKGDPSHPP